MEMIMTVITHFKWQNARLNFQEYPRYSPSLPWVSNITKEGKFAADFWNYIDNIRRISSLYKEG